MAIVDLRLAAVSDTGTLNNDGITKLTTVSFTGTAIGHPITPGDAVTIWLDLSDDGVIDAGETTQVTVLVNPVSGAFSGTIALAEGTWNNIRAYDWVDASFSNAVDITIDTTAVAPIIDLDPASDGGISGTDNISNDTSPTFNIDLSDASHQVGDIIHIKMDNIEIDTYTIQAGDLLANTYAYTLGADVHAAFAGDGTEDAQYTFTATITDAAGNLSVDSAPIYYTLDTQAPTTSVGSIEISADTGNSAADFITRTAGQTITATLSVELVAGEALYASINGGANWTNISNKVTGTAVSWDGVTLAVGTSSIQMKVVDSAGDGPLATQAFTLDQTANAPAALDLVVGSDSGNNADDITNDTTPTITGTGEIGATVTLTSDVDGAVGTAVVDGGGNWSITASALTVGAQSLTATQTDVAGNTSVASGALAITIDTTAAAPAALNLADGSDSGASNSDDITNDTTPTITGTGEVGATVTLTSDVDGAVGTALVAGDGTWSIDAAVLTEGAQSLTATQTDVAGNVSVASAPLAITIDTTVAAPAALNLADASDSGDSNSDDLTNDTTPIITGTGEIGATVTLTSDVDGAVGTATVAGDGTWSITASALTEGAQSLTATQTDVAGNTSVASGPLAITIDTTAAAPAALDLVVGSDSGNNADDITSDTTPTIAGTGEVGATVTLTSDVDGVVGTAVVDGGGNWSITSSVLTEGAQSLTATQTDVAGNTSVASGPLAITIDTTANAPAALNLADGSDSGVSNSDDITNDTTPTITGTGEVGATVTLTSDVDGAVGTALVAGDGTWSIDAAVLTEGAQSLTATQTDVAGNVSAASAPLAITIDTTVAAPAALNLADGSDSGDSNSDDLTNDTTPTITGTGEVGAIVTLTSDVDGVVGTAIVAGDGTWSIDSTALTVGAQSLTATQTDVAGNISVASGALAITIDNDAPAAPAALDLAAGSDSGNNADDITSDTTPTISGTGEVGATVTLTSDVDGQVGTAVVAGDGTWSIDTAVLTEGAQSLTATQTDAAGNTSVASAPLALTIDTTVAAPAALDLRASTDTGISDTDDITSDTTPTIEGTGEVGALVTLTSDVDGLVGAAVVAGDGTWSIDTAALTEGAQSLTATQTDVAGNLSAASTALAITVDANPPTVAITSSAPSVNAGGTATLTFAFDEVPAGFTLADITVEGALGTVSGLTQDLGTDPTGKTYTATFTAGNTPDAAVTVTVGVDWTDAAGNAGVGDTVDVGIVASDISGTANELAPGGIVIASIGAGTNVRITDSGTLAQIDAINDANGGGDLEYSSVADVAANLAADGGAYINGTVDVIVTDAASLAQLATIAGLTTGTLNYDAIADAAAALGADITYINNSVNVEVTDASVDIDALAAIVAKTEGVVTYDGVQGSAASLVTNLGLLSDASGVTVTGAASIDQLTQIDAQAGVLAYTAISDTVANLIADQNTYVDGVVNVTVSGSANVTGKQLNTLDGYTNGAINVTGTAASNTLFGTAGDNTIDGGDGIDTLSYGNATVAVTVNLATVGAQNTGGAGSDTLSNIENLTGSNFSDTLSGTSGDNTLNGGKGIDTVSYAAAAGAVNVDLGAGTATGASIATDHDTLVSIERAMGGNFADTLSGSAGNNSLHGLNGNDVLNGGAGNDLLVGGSQNDTLSGGLGSDRLNGGFGVDIFNYGATNEGGDTIVDFAVNSDKLQFLGSAFGGLTAGALAAGNFVSGAGAVAVDGDDYFVYDTTTHKLYYDADGSGAGAVTLIGTFSNHAALTAADFRIV